MTRDEIITKLRDTAPALKAEGGTSLAIFGSRARDEAREDGYLDIFVGVRPREKFSLLDLIRVGHIIRDATGLKAHADVRRSLELRFAERTADDVIEVF